MRSCQTLPDNIGFYLLYYDVDVYMKPPVLEPCSDSVLVLYDTKVFLVCLIWVLVLLV